MDKNTLEKAASTLAPDMPRKQKTRILMEILRAEPDFFSPEHLFIGDPGEYENEIARRTASIVWAAAASGELYEDDAELARDLVDFNAPYHCGETAAYMETELPVVLGNLSEAGADFAAWFYAGLYSAVANQREEYSFWELWSKNFLEFVDKAGTKEEKMDAISLYRRISGSIDGDGFENFIDGVTGESDEWEVWNRPEFILAVLLYYPGDEWYEKRKVLEKIIESASEDGAFEWCVTLLDADERMFGLLYGDEPRKFFRNLSRENGLFGTLLEHGLASVDEILEKCAFEGVENTFPLLFREVAHDRKEILAYDVKTCFRHIFSDIASSEERGDKERLLAHAKLVAELSEKSIPGDFSGLVERCVERVAAGLASAMGGVKDAEEAYPPM